MTESGKAEAGGGIEWDTPEGRVALFVGFVDKGPEARANKQDLRLAGFAPAASLTAALAERDSAETNFAKACRELSGLRAQREALIKVVELHQECGDNYCEFHQGKEEEFARECWTCDSIDRLRAAKVELAEGSQGDAMAKREDQWEKLLHALRAEHRDVKSALVVALREKGELEADARKLAHHLQSPYIEVDKAEALAIAKRVLCINQPSPAPPSITPENQLPCLKCGGGDHCARGCSEAPSEAPASAAEEGENVAEALRCVELLAKRLTGYRLSYPSAEAYEAGRALEKQLERLVALRCGTTRTGLDLARDAARSKMPDLDAALDNVSVRSQPTPTGEAKEATTADRVGAAMMSRGLWLKRDIIVDGKLDGAPGEPGGSQDGVAPTAQQTGHLPSTRLYGGNAMPVATATERCPSCDSPNPKLHPSIQHEGEVRICSDAWHGPVATATEGEHEHDDLGYRYGCMVCQAQANEPPPASPPASDAGGHWSDCHDCVRHGGYCAKHPASPPPAALGPVELVIEALRKLSHEVIAMDSAQFAHMLADELELARQGGVKA
jgi:hypothetical protein